MMHERFHPVADRLHGSLVTPDDSEYDRARGAWNLMYSHRPSLTRHAGGAISRPPGETAYTTRGADRLLQVVALTMTPEAVADTHTRLERLWGRLEKKLVGPYLNFLEGEERVAAGASAFEAAAWQRLLDAKRSIDPTGMFSHGLVLEG